MTLLRRLGEVKMSSAARAGNAATAAMFAAHTAGISFRCGWPLPPPAGIGETAVLALVVLWLRWQKRLSARLLYTVPL